MTQTRRTRFGSHHPTTTTQAEVDRKNPPTWKRACGICQTWFNIDPRQKDNIHHYCRNCLNLEAEAIMEMNQAFEERHG